MKANELMIGDLVLEKSVDYVDGVIKYVEEKRNVTTNMLHQLYNQETGILGKDNLYSIQVEPIPLTTEILEKNGFDVSDGEVMRYNFEEDGQSYHFSLRQMYNQKNNKPNGYSFYAFNVLTIIDYVHQLQHALKLCGIEKEIQL